MSDNSQSAQQAPITTMPPVAKSIFVFCKKCDSDRYQTVLAHTNETTAKLQCEVCKTKNTWKLPKLSKVTGKPLAPKKLGGAALTRKTAAAEAKKRDHSDAYNAMAATAVDNGNKYNMKIKFVLNEKVDHPKFGTGYVRAALIDKIEVIFADEIRMLVHNRQA